MATLRLFRKSWYGNVWMMMLFSALSAFLVTFYTTAESFSWSLTSLRHLVTWLFSFVLLFVVVCTIACVVCLLDIQAYFLRHELLRYLLQFVVLVVGLGAIALKVVYRAYFVVFGIDLQSTDYFERDYVVVLFCIIMVQVYYAVRKERRLRAYAGKRIVVLTKKLQQQGSRTQEAVDQSEGLQLQLAHLQLDKDNMEQLYVDKLAQLSGRKQQLRACHEQVCADGKRLKAGVTQASEEVEVMIGADKEWVRMVQIAYFYLKEGSSRVKMVNVKLLDGREGTVDMDSLAKGEKRWPHAFFRVGRWHLIQHMAVRELLREEDKYMVVLYGQERERYILPMDTYDKLVGLRQEWVAVLKD